MEVLLGGIACLLGEFQNLFCYNFKQLAFPCQKFCSDQWFYLLPVTVATSWQWSCDLSALHSFCYYYSLHVAVSTPCWLWLEFTLIRLPYGDIQSCHATTDQQHVAYVVRVLLKAGPRPGGPRPAVHLTARDPAVHLTTHGPRPTDFWSVVY